MTEQSKALTGAEWRCLRAIGKGGRFTSPAVPTGATSGTACSEAALHGLASRGLIEPATELWLPLEMKRSVYRLTAAGKSMLKLNRKG